MASVLIYRIHPLQTLNSQVLSMRGVAKGNSSGSCPQTAVRLRRFMFGDEKLGA